VLGFQSFGGARDHYKFEKFLQGRLTTLLPKYNPTTRPVLVFCTSQAGACNTGK
jgi:hypothetical protein